jgi:hypothetical protein
MGALGAGDGGPVIGWDFGRDEREKAGWESLDTGAATRAHRNMPETGA